MEQNSSDSEEKMTCDGTAVGLNDQTNDENAEEEDVKTAIETKKTPRKIEDTIEWYLMDEEMRLAHVERVKNSPKSSLWEYNPKGGVPSELANLDPSTFLTTPLGLVFCFLPLNIFVCICSKLTVFDFVNLSLTCRFLHWRMYTFCTCYAPYTVKMRISDDILTDSWKMWVVDPKWIYTINNGVIDNAMAIDGFGLQAGLGEAVGIWQYPRELDGLRGHFVYQPFCLRRPFFFETLQLKLALTFYCKNIYDRVLPYILAVRGLARHLDIEFLTEYNIPNSPFYFSDTMIFLRPSMPAFIAADIYINCPYARQMKRVCIFRYSTREKINVPVFENSIGIYWLPLNNAIITTLKNFLTGSTDLVFHQYLHIENHNDRFPLVEYLFQQFGEFKEIFYENIQYECYYYIWKKVVATENGGQLRIMIEKRQIHGRHVTIGKEEMFDEMNNKYGIDPPFEDGNIWWEMETAVEPSESEEADVAVESDEAVESKAAAETNIIDEHVAVESDETEELDETEDFDEADAEQGASGACLCLNNISCSIQ